MSYEPDVEAMLSTRALDCPACGAPGRMIANRPHAHVTGLRMVCLRCDAQVIVFNEDATLRDGLFAWNTWVRKAREKRQEAP